MGSWAFGNRNAKGDRIIQWLLSHRFQIVGRFATTSHNADNWICKRARDGALVQLDFILVDMGVEPSLTWHDFAIATGVDHRCVRCRLHVPVATPRTRMRKPGKAWQPFLDMNHVATGLRLDLDHV